MKSARILGLEIRALRYTRSGMYIYIYIYIAQLQRNALRCLYYLQKP